MGPLYNVNIVNNPTSKFGFVEFVDESSVIYACKMMQGLKLFGKSVTVKPRSKTAKVGIRFNIFHILFFSFDVFYLIFIF